MQRCGRQYSFSNNFTIVGLNDRSYSTWEHTSYALTSVGSNFLSSHVFLFFFCSCRVSGWTSKALRRFSQDEPFTDGCWSMNTAHSVKLTPRKLRHIYVNSCSDDANSTHYSTPCYLLHLVNVTLLTAHYTVPNRELNVKGPWLQYNWTCWLIPHSVHFFMH